jgi:hypothetical protein
MFIVVLMSEGASLDLQFKIASPAGETATFQQWIASASIVSTYIKGGTGFQAARGS